VTRTIARTKAANKAARLSAIHAQLTLDGKGPVWLQIRRAISRMVAKRYWPPGTRIPSEVELTEHFGASRMTVNKAILSLARDGLVERHRKVGTLIADRAQERPAFEIWDIQDIIGRAGGTYCYELLKSELLKEDSEKRSSLNVSRKTKVLWMRCLHFSNEVPFQLEERLVNVAAAPGIMSQHIHEVAPGPWLFANVPWTEAEHTISASEASENEAAALRIRPGAACLLVERKTWNKTTPVTFVRLWHPGRQHRLKGRFEPNR
jgi:GntR family transcriptional regulator, histidine utilization repressor